VTPCVGDAAEKRAKSLIKIGQYSIIIVIAKHKTLELEG